MADKTSTASGGIGCTSPLALLLALLFITLKLIGKIDWSWWWVLAPIWIPWGIVLVVVIFCVIMAIITDQV